MAQSVKHERLSLSSRAGFESWVWQRLITIKDQKHEFRMLVRKGHSSCHKLTIMDTNNHSDGVYGWIKRTAVVR